MKSKCLRLTTPSEVRKALAKVANMVLQNEIPSATANTFVYCANAILTSIRADETEKRLAELERLCEDISTK